MKPSHSGKKPQEQLEASEMSWIRVCIGTNARKSGLTLTRAWILQVISQRKEMTATEISAYTGTTLPTITGILESLVKTRCIIKNRNAKDGRKLVVSISETGSEKLRKFLNLQQMFVERIEQATDKAFLDKLPMFDQSSISTDLSSEKLLSFIILRDPNS